MNIGYLRGLLFCVFLQLISINKLRAIEYPYIVSLGIEKGLSNNAVRCTYRDHNGFMWFGTHDGLNRFDGYGFKVFRNQLGDTNSLPHNYIYDIHEDHQHNLWIGTGQGAGIFNNLTHKFFPVYYFSRHTGKRWKIATAVNVIKTAANGDVLIGTNGWGLMVRPKNKETASQIALKKDGKDFTDFNVTAIKIDAKQRIWLFIDPLGLCVYDAAKRQLRVVNQTLTSGASCMETDNHENIWIGTEYGLFKYHIPSNSMVTSKKEELGALTCNHVISLHFDKKSDLWIGTNGGGVNILNPVTGKITYLSSLGTRSYLASEVVLSIYDDNEGRKWIGTSKSGINIIDSRSSCFRTIARDPLNTASLVSNFVSSFLEAQDGKIWIGTDGGGLSLWDRSRNKFTNLKQQVGNRNSLSNNLISDIQQDYLGDIWISTSGGGINRLNKSNNTFEHFSCKNGVSGVENKFVRMLFEDHDKTLWATTFSNGKLYYFNRHTNQFEIFDQNLSDLISISEDHHQVLWGGNFSSLVKIDRKRKKHIYYDIGKPIHVIYEDKKGNLWIGSEGGGLALFNARQGKIVKRYSTADGLSNNFILGILEDGTGNLWISTSGGLSKFNPTTRTFLSFYQDDGLQSNQFIDRAALKLKSGEMVFGGLKGFNIFHPDSVDLNKNIPPVLITGIRINNLPASIDGPYVTQVRGDQIEALKIPFDDAVLAFDFAALEYTAPAKISYAYYMEGWDKGWNYSNKLRTASYTKLGEGNYVLHIKSTNAAGVWMTNEKIISVYILPPWYRSLWAYLAYFMAGVGLVYIYILYQKRQSYLKYQVDLANLEVRKEQELSENKLSFFTHISHEFRTPLTLIINPIKEFINNKDHRIDPKDLMVVYRNATRLHHLVDQLLLFRKSEVQELIVTKFDLVALCEEICACFNQQAKSKKITFDFQCTLREISIYADRDKIEIVLFNLIANAFKFTPVSGHISVRITEQDKEVHLYVTDTGAGIAEGAGDKIFERFYQDGNQKSANGFGIGLFLVKKFIEGHGGQVQYKSSTGHGTEFELTILKGKDHFEKHLVHEDRTLSYLELMDKDNYADSLLSVDTDVTVDVNDFETITEKKVILIVEDNSDIRSYVKQIFKQDYTVYEAENGAVGLELVRKYVPDLVITDIIMKELSGVDLCMEIKSNQELSHIPVILLTSSSSPEIKLKAIEIGADDFITKPFDKDILIARVANLLKSRSTLQHYFFNQITLKSNDFKVSKEYKDFLEKCIAITEKHLDNSDFNVKMLADELETIPSVLYRKVKSISGKSTNEFIRYIRLRKAAQLLVSGKYNVNEAAMLCGFIDVRYFREQFTKLFGIRPSEYMKKYRTHFSDKHRLNKDMIKIDS